MRKYTRLLSPLLLGLWSLTAAGDEDISTPGATAFSAAPAATMSGQAVAARLTQNYRNTAADCGAGKPAYLCSGITLQRHQP